MKKLTLTAFLIINISAQANKDIHYNFLEIGYGYLDINDNINPDGFYLDGAFNLSDRFYIGGFIDGRASQGIDFNRYDISLGFHTSMTNKTDFYTNLRLGKIEYDNLDGNTVGLYAGTRTAFNDRFELISKIGLTNIDDIEFVNGANQIIYEAEVKGLFKFTPSQALTAGLESFEGNPGARVGYRFSF